MATYIPNATQTTEPTEDRTVESAALEFRTLKSSVGGLQAQIDAAAVVQANQRLQYLRVPESSVDALPGAGTRAGKALAFDASGKPIAVAVSGTSDPSLRADLAQPTGSALVGFQQADAGAVARTVDDLLSEVVSVRSFLGVDPTGATPSTAGIAAALARVQLTGQKLQGVPGDLYLIDTDFVVDGLPIKLDLDGCTVRQSINGRGFLQLRASGNEVKNVHVEYTGTRSFISGGIRFRGYSAWQRMCAVWCESGGNLLDNITSKNMNNTLCLRGPVVQNPAGAGYTGADTDPSTAYIYDAQALDNRVDEIHGVDQDFVITGHQQDGLQIGDYSAKRITNIQQEPPHAIYMRSPTGTTKAGRAFVRSGNCDTNIYGVAHKFLHFAKLTIGTVNAFGATGGLLVEDCDDVVITDLISTGTAIRDDGAGSPIVEPRYGFYANNSKVRIGLLHVDGVAGLECGGALITGTADVSIDDVVLTSRSPVGSDTAGVVRSEGAAKVRIGSFRYEPIADGTVHALKAVDTSRIVCGCASAKNTSRIARGNVHVSFDPLALDTALDDSSFMDGATQSRILPYVESSIGSTMTVYGASSSGAHTYSTQGVRVVRAGPQVTIYAKFTISGAFGGTGDVRIGPLPYLPRTSASSPDSGVIISSAANITLGAGEFLIAAANDGESYVRLQTMAGITKASLGAAAMGTNARIEFVLTYETADAI
jgi:hypothetical protein